MRKRFLGVILLITLAMVGVMGAKSEAKAATISEIKICAIDQKQEGGVSSIVPYPSYQTRIEVILTGLQFIREKVNVTIRNNNDEMVRAWNSTSKYLDWDGKDTDGKMVGEGSYKVTATLNGTSDTKIFYLLRQPTTKPTLTISGITSTSAKCSWTKVADANTYMLEIFRGSKCVVRKYITGTSYTYSSFMPASTFKYSVTAMKKYSSKYYYVTGATVASKSFKTKYYLSKPTAKCKKKSKTSIQLTWKRNKNAKGYQIYMATSKKGKYKKIATISKNKTVKYIKKKLKRKKTYYFKIRSYVKISGVTLYSDYSSLKSCRLK